MEIPTWVECSIKVKEGDDLTPLEQFVCGQEPGKLHGDEKWREQLQAVVDSLI